MNSPTSSMGPGLLPLALGCGPGAAPRVPMAFSLPGGPLAATLLTSILLTPTGGSAAGPARERHPTRAACGIARKASI
ncbi:MAG: hypothetical protein MI919_37385 [Holophagales bacterium]|nr:hypothetical protein [Holophagales bacterium]